MMFKWNTTTCCYEKVESPAEPNTGAPTSEPTSEPPKKSREDLVAAAKSAALRVEEARERLFAMQQFLNAADREFQDASVAHDNAIRELGAHYHREGALKVTRLK